MNFFGLARRSVFRKPIKSILLLLIVFAISTLLLAGVASKNASIEVQDKTRQAIGAGFLLERNAEYRTKRVREYSEKIGNVRKVVLVATIRKKRLSMVWRLGQAGQQMNLKA